jgi:hypothetical protein
MCNERFRDRNARHIAQLHVATLREWFTQSEWVTMCARNAAPDRREGVCHSHDFCDANDSMAAAFKRVMGRDIDGDNEADCALWNAAWEIADPVLSAKRRGVIMFNKSVDYVLPQGVPRVPRGRDAAPPEGFNDQSWHNDVCPHFDHDKARLQV